LGAHLFALIAPNRVTRCGEFSAIGRLNTLRSFFTLQKRPNFGQFFSAVKVMQWFLQKNWLGPHFGRFFSQTHLVTLAPNHLKEQNDRYDVIAFFSTLKDELGFARNPSVST
jgi:hypothetical protein